MGEVEVALVACGTQHRVLLRCCLEAVCDEQSVLQAMHVDSQHSGTQPMAALGQKPPDEPLNPQQRLMSRYGETRLSG